MAALGERFRAAREARGLSLSEVAEQIRIRSVYLAEIEAENWAAIGAPVYVRGFLRTYGRFLGLDAEEAVAEFNGTAAGAPVSEMNDSAAREDAARPILSPLTWIAGVVAALLVAFVIYNFFSLRQPSGAPAPSALETALPSNSPIYNAKKSPQLVPTPVSAPQTLAVNVASGSWLRVTVDGNVSMEGTFPRGTRREFHGKTALVRVGNAGGVEITVDGKPIGKLGAIGDVVERRFTL
ncbi:MAG: hypothetical protein DLM50_01780 [Candidatus Meridianibacter frigidus]|nr:MAG: hypothetical protein DLM50_01780 [Candidatus Eremiobacteraeota bacterium]